MLVTNGTVHFHSGGHRLLSDGGYLRDHRLDRRLLRSTTVERFALARPVGPWGNDRRRAVLSRRCLALIVFRSVVGRLRSRGIIAIGGLPIAEIARRLGRAQATVKAYLYDPSYANKRPMDSPEVRQFWALAGHARTSICKRLLGFSLRRHNAGVPPLPDLSGCSSPGDAGQAALVLATQQFVANGGGGRHVAAGVLHRRGGRAALAVSVSVGWWRSDSQLSPPRRQTSEFSGGCGGLAPPARRLARPVQKRPPQAPELGPMAARCTNRTHRTPSRRRRPCSPTRLPQPRD
jgi:hypothetical protein